jgi:sugar phosphate permease
MKELLIKRILKNKLVWYVCMANFFVYFVRMTMFFWAPTFLQEAKASTLSQAAYQTAIYDVAGIVGGLLAGHLADKFAKGYRGRVSAVFMFLLSGCIVGLWQSPAGATAVHFLCMLGVGFFITGPQVLVGVAASDFASKRAAGTATGITGTFGYAGNALAGVGIAAIAQKAGWDMAFITIIAAALCGALFFILTWNHRSRVLEKN